MAAPYCFTIAPVKSSKPKQFHNGKLRPHSSKLLFTVRSQNQDLRSSNNRVSAPDSTTPEGTRRPTFDFAPSVWGDYFISSASSALNLDAQTDEKIEQLKRQVKSILCSVVTDLSQQLVFIDKIQKLGVAYHFEDEFSKVLQHIYDNTAHEDGDLNIVALRFRLLRQAGHFVSSGVFSKFKDEKGEFLVGLTHDLQGLLSLYEAGHLVCPGEDILDKAIAFSTHHLQCVANHLNLDSTSHIRRALDLPLWKRIPRIEATYYMSVYENLEGSVHDVLLQFAKLDYNALQLLHQTELSQLSRWWKESGILAKLPFKARDKLVEVYAIVMSVIPEPKYSLGRIFNAKYMALLTVIDDIFDAYGTNAELQSIANAILSWDIKDIDQLPDYAKGVILEMHNIFIEIEEHMAMKGLEYAVPYFKTQAQCYIGCLLDESKLFHSKRVPTLEEWWKFSVTTNGGKLMIIGLVLAHWDLLTKEAMEWSTSDTQGNYSCAWCCRILGDIKTFKLEQKRGNMASSVTCYMKEHGVSEHEAIEELGKMLDEGWKQMNKECLNPTTPIPLRLLMVPINTMRMLEFSYMYGDDGFTHSGGKVKEMIASLLVNPVPT